MEEKGMIECEVGDTTYNQLPVNSIFEKDWLKGQQTQFNNSFHSINTKRINKFIFFNWFHEIHLLNWMGLIKKVL